MSRFWVCAGASARGHGWRGRSAAGAAPAHTLARHAWLSAWRLAWSHARICAWRHARARACVSARGGRCWGPWWAASLAPAARGASRGLPRTAGCTPSRGVPCRAGRGRRGRAARGRPRPQYCAVRIKPCAGCARCGGRGFYGGAASHGEWRCERDGGSCGGPCWPPAAPL